MALAESIEYDKIEVVGLYKHVQGTLDGNNELVDTDLSAEPAEVSAICNAVWTTDVKAAWKAKLIADKSVI